MRLVPEVADELLPAVYRAASVFAFPSLAEGYGIPVLEAMASGVPVIASRIPALAEVTGSAAVLVSPRDVPEWVSAVLAVLTEPGMAARLAAAGAAVAADRTWERGATALRGLLSRVATGNLAAPLETGPLETAPLETGPFQDAPLADTPSAGGTAPSAPAAAR